jgi:RNA 2',3'-cyclic 3'-phosphodiesterase
VDLRKRQSQEGLAVRLFIALNLPTEVRSRVAAEVIAPLQALLPGVRWVREETLHLTLLFLGERDEAGMREARAVVLEVAADCQPFRVSLCGLGAFPTRARPRVVWLGVAEPAPVRALSGVLERERERLGAPAEGRPYTPHLTLGRVPPHAQGAVQAALAPALAAVRFEAAVTFTSLDLVRSELTPQGPRYTVLLSAPLGGRRTR